MAVPLLAWAGVSRWQSTRTMDELCGVWRSVLHDETLRIARHGRRYTLTHYMPGHVPQRCELHAGRVIHYGSGSSRTDIHRAGPDTILLDPGSSYIRQTIFPTHKNW